MNDATNDAHSPLRLDQLLVELGLARSRTRAQRLIKHGRVSLLGPGGERVVKRPGEKLPRDSRFRLEEDPQERYVSRAGLKLEGLLDGLGIDLEGQILLDVGQSTGGFSDCALRFGAARVIGIEVGHGQLDETLRQDARVVCLEGVNARALPDARLRELAPEGLDGAMIDVSFISQTLILPELARLLPPNAGLYSLVKPQFELSPDEIDGRGLVRHPRHYAEVERRLRKAAADAGFEVLHWEKSVILGGDGNQEFMMLARRLGHAQEG
ncbi:TlyA family RNA methyltransferase [Halotalea alkalilenta]|uniref:TlyA family RNA methyltransferase n=1 Tax=Halotalea alkalilenta TaxID=376489 RepID=UPI0006936347|nr:TlyA family RNA methyltransferase [Halotalea alkalilenta]